MLKEMGAAVATTARAVAVTANAVRATTRWGFRGVGAARARSGGGNRDLTRLLDRHASSAAGDTLAVTALLAALLYGGGAPASTWIAIGLIPVIMLVAVPALLADSLRDRIDRAGQGLALATTVGRAALALLLTSGWGVPAALALLALSRLDAWLRAGTLATVLAGQPRGEVVGATARARRYAIAAGLLVAPAGLLGLAFGSQWPARLAVVAYLTGAVCALMPPHPATGPHQPAKPATSDRLDLLSVVAPRAAAAYLVTLLALSLSSAVAFALVLLALAAGSLAAAWLGHAWLSRLPEGMSPVPLYGGAAGLAAIAGAWAALRPSLGTTLALGLAATAAGGLTRLARHDTDPAATETALSVAWLAGLGFGLLPVTPRLGVPLAALILLAGALAPLPGRLRAPAAPSLAPHGPAPRRETPSAAPEAAGPSYRLFVATVPGETNDPHRLN